MNDTVSVGGPWQTDALLYLVHHSSLKAFFLNLEFSTYFLINKRFMLRLVTLPISGKVYGQGIFVADFGENIFESKVVN